MSSKERNSVLCNERIVRNPGSGYWGEERVMRLQRNQGEALRQSVLQEKEHTRTLGGYTCVGPNLIRLQIQQQVRAERNDGNDENEELRDGGDGWVNTMYTSSPLSLFEAKVTHSELVELLRMAKYANDHNWRYVRLRWTPTFFIDPLNVGAEAAERLCEQLSSAIAKAEHAGDARNKKGQ